MKLAKGGKIVEFLVEYIISRYGVPSKLFMDNGPSFRGNKVKEFCEKYYNKCYFCKITLWRGKILSLIHFNKVISLFTISYSLILSFVNIQSLLKSLVYYQVMFILLGPSLIDVSQNRHFA